MVFGRGSMPAHKSILMDMSVAAKDVYSLLGELLHVCQRIEWTVKYLVEQAYRKVEFKSVDELHKPPMIEERWQSNPDTLGKVIKDFLQGFYGEPGNDCADTDRIRLEMRYSFNADADADVRAENRQRREAELSELLSIRNFLAHQFGLRYPLQDEENCAAAMAYLEDAKTKLKKHIELLNFEIKMFQTIRQEACSLAASPDMPLIVERLRRAGALKGKIGKLKTYDFSNMADRTIFDFTDRQDVIEAILYGESDITLDAYMAKPIEVRLANLQWLADLTENRNFIEAVRKQQQKRGVV